MEKSIDHATSSDIHQGSPSYQHDVANDSGLKVTNPLLNGAPDRPNNHSYSYSEEGLPVWTDPDSKIEDPRRDRKGEGEVK